MGMEKRTRTLICALTGILVPVVVWVLAVVVVLPGEVVVRVVLLVTVEQVLEGVLEEFHLKRQDGVLSGTVWRL